MKHNGYYTDVELIKLMKELFDYLNRYIIQFNVTFLVIGTHIDITQNILSNEKQQEINCINFKK